MKVVAVLGLGCALALGLAAPAGADDAIVYLDPEPSGRHRPTIDRGGPVAVIADVDSVTAPVMASDGKVAFSGALGDESLGRYGVFVVDSDGTNLTQLTGGDFAEFDPAWAPDGETIAFAQNQNGSILAAQCCRLAVVDVSSGDMTGLTASVGVARPSYSNQGDFIVYDTPQGVWRIPSGGGTPTLVVPGGYDASTSPNDESIVYLAKDGPSTTEVRRVPVGGGTSTALLETTGEIENPFWVGNRIYFLEHTGLGYDGRKAVRLLSVSQGGQQWRVERTFTRPVVGVSPAFDNDEIFFYRTDGLFRYYQIFTDGRLPAPLLGGNGYTTGWDAIAPVDLDGDGQDEIFFYRDDGLFRYYQIRPNGSLPLPSTAGIGYTQGWDAITALDLDGDGFDEMFFYRDDGLFRFYDIKPDGSLPKPMLAGSNYTPGWDAITDVDLDGDGFDEMFFYRTDGLYRFYDVGPTGVLGQPISQGSNFGANWTSITALDLDGDGNDEFFLYRDDGEFAYHELQTDGDLGRLIAGGSGYTAGWSIITGINLVPG